MLRNAFIVSDNPKWLHERNQSNTTREMTEEEKALLKEQQQAFRQQLELDWED